MNARDELWDLLERTFDDVNLVYDAVTTAILAAGYRKPRTITTAEELDALAGWSIVEAKGVAMVRASTHEACWESTSRHFAYSSAALIKNNGPVTVLFDSEATA